MISLAAWKAGGASFEHDGHRVFTRSGGAADAPVLLLIHGFPTASWDWEALWPELARDYRLFTLDMIGFGFSAKPPASRFSYSILDQASLFEAYLGKEGVTAYYVLAHDYGVTVAQELLARRSEPGPRPTLESVCFLNGGLFPQTHRALFTQKLLLSPVGPLVARLTTKRRFAAGIRHVFGAGTQPSATTLDAFWELIEENDGRSVLPLLLRYMPERRLRRARWVGALQRASVPLKVINGLADPVSGAHMVARYRELVPAPDTTGLPGIGHWPQVEAPAAVLEAYREFRSRIATR